MTAVRVHRSISLRVVRRDCAEPHPTVTDNTALQQPMPRVHIAACVAVFSAFSRVEF